MNVWVLWRDTGEYSDWMRVVVGVYATLAVAQAAAAQDADGYRWWDDEAPLHGVLGEWEPDTERPGAWTASCIPTGAISDPMDYVAAQFTVQDGAPPPIGTGG